MARKSRKQTITGVSAAGSAKSLAGIYARLSVEDNGDRTKDSMQNQISFLQEYIKDHEEEIQLVRIYIEKKTADLIQNQQEGAALCLKL